MEAPLTGPGTPRELLLCSAVSAEQEDELRAVGLAPRVVPPATCFGAYVAGEADVAELSLSLWALGGGHGRLLGVTRRSTPLDQLWGRAGASPSLDELLHGRIGVEAYFQTSAVWLRRQLRAAAEARGVSATATFVEGWFDGPADDRRLPEELYASRWGVPLPVPRRALPDLLRAGDVLAVQAPDRNRGIADAADLAPIRLDGTAGVDDLRRPVPVHVLVQREGANPVDGVPASWACAAADVEAIDELVASVRAEVQGAATEPARMH